jgi:hypothetical protein
MGGLGDLLGLMRNAGALKQRVADAHAALARQTVEGSAGDGLVVARASGMQELVGLTIDPRAVADGRVERLEEWVRSAVGEAMTKARDLQKAEMSRLLGGLPLPPGFGDLLG